MERPDAGSNAGGFDFELVKRNAMLAAKGVKPPTAWKTGTTIAGVIYKVRAGMNADECHTHEGG
jgi:20S proteasome subunit beta 2